MYEVAKFTHTKEGNSMPPGGCLPHQATWLALFALIISFFIFILLSHHLCRPQRHCSHAARPRIPHLQPHPGLILHCGPAPRGPQEEMSDRWWAAIRRKHCTAASVVFSSACSDGTYAGHHLLCPLLTTMLAKLRSQTE